MKFTTNNYKNVALDLMNNHQMNIIINFISNKQENMSREENFFDNL